MLMALAPLHKAYTIKRIVASTYQAASGAGYKGLEELLENKAPCVFPHPYKYNLFLHESPIEENAGRRPHFQFRKRLSGIHDTGPWNLGGFKEYESKCEELRASAGG